ncbi:MAG: ABC transporter ATP-binding protein [Cyclobacteriaceae bacterium]
MRIEARGLGKRFNRDWIFKDLNTTIESGSKLAIVGPNGSGKSTLLKILGTYSIPTRGEISYHSEHGQLSTDDIQVRMNFAAPYFNLIEEYTLAEQLAFHAKFKEADGDIQTMIKDAGLIKAQHKFIKDFSSGMKQRAKLIMAFGFAADLILLDEPTSNLDEKGISWFESLIKSMASQPTIIMASNLQQEISLCDSVISIEKNQG